MKYAYINGKILDGTKDMQVKEGFVILTDNDKIEDIVKAGTDLNGYEKVDLKRRYIMPGLINMHVHLAGNGKPQKKQRDNEKLVKILMGNALMRSIAYGMVAGFAKTELMSGVTTIRTVGGLGSFDTKLRDEINAGTKMGPRILAANEGISVPGGHMAGSVAVAADSIDTALKHLPKNCKSSWIGCLERNPSHQCPEMEEHSDAKPLNIGIYGLCRLKSRTAGMSCILMVFIWEEKRAF